MGETTVGNKLASSQHNFKAPFAHLNLRFNPFGEIDIDDRARAAVINYQPWVNAFLKNPNFVLQFSGDCGRGKSTHLHGLKMHLQTHFPDVSYSYYAEDEVVRSLPNKASLLILDETQRIPKRLRQKLWKRNCGFIIGTHENHSQEFIKQGREFEHVLLEGITEDKLRQVLEARLELARRTQTNSTQTNSTQANSTQTNSTQAPIPYFTDHTIQKLIQDFGDDIRAIEHYLYHVFQDLKEVGHV